MSERISAVEKAAIAKLPEKLQLLCEEVQQTARDTGQSFHDAMCDIEECRPNEYSFEERAEALHAMGSYWD